jgi:hypothetical protein
MAKGKYETHVKPKLLLIEAWCRDGLTDEQIYKNLDISHESFYKYKKEHVEFTDTLKRGKEVIDVMVENALLKSALGYEYEEEAMTRDGPERLRKVAHPNTTALIFWLKNRKPKEWRDKHEIESHSEVVNKHEYHIEQNIKSDPETAELLKQLYKRSINSSVGDLS